jgi:Pentapeptide repeats (8 copies)
LASHLFTEFDATQLNRAIGGVGPEPSVTSVGVLLRALAHANLELMFTFVVGVTLSVYLICRPLACGYRLANLVLGRPDGLGVPRRTAELGRAAHRLSIPSKEAETLAAIDAAAPREMPFDLVVKALPAAALLFMGFYGTRTILVDPSDRSKFRAFAVVAVARLLWLGCASHRRGAGVMWLAVLATVLVVAGLGANPFGRYERRPLGGSGLGGALHNEQLRSALSLRHDLSGADLGGRDLRTFYLVGKDLSYANLSDARLQLANLAHAHLHDADLRGANLRVADLSATDLRAANLANANLSNAQLRHSDLRRADLSGANVDGAGLCDVDLSGADLSGLLGAPIYDERTRWPRGPPRPRQSEFGDCNSAGFD